MLRDVWVISHMTVFRSKGRPIWFLGGGPGFKKKKKNNFEFYKKKKKNSGK